jgi:hypothetical protein
MKAMMPTLQNGDCVRRVLYYGAWGGAMYVGRALDTAATAVSIHNTSFLQNSECG